MNLIEKCEKATWVRFECNKNNGGRGKVWAGCVMGDSKNRTNLAFTNNYRCLNQHCDVATYVNQKWRTHSNWQRSAARLIIDHR